MNSGSHVQNEGGRIEITGRNTESRICNRLGSSVPGIHRFTILHPVKRNVGGAIDGGVGFICMVGKGHAGI